MTDLPKIDTLWRHKNRNVYIVEEYSNKLDTEKYPLNIMHRNITNGALYNRPATDWHRSMTQIEPGEFVKLVNGSTTNFIVQIPGLGAFPITPLTECRENARRIAEEAMIDYIKDRLDAIRKKITQGDS